MQNILIYYRYYRAMTIYRTTYMQYAAAADSYHNISDIISQDDELMQDFDRFLADNQTNTTNEMNEFERYLADPLYPRSSSEPFNILAWWKENASRYPSVASMARDILAIPITSVASESVSEL